MKVLDLKPTNAIGGASILNIDVRVDFAPPVGYVEPKYTPSIMNKPSVS